MRTKGKARQDAGSTDGVRSGYESKSVPDDISIPEVTLESVDRALMSLFDTTINFNVPVKGGETKKVPVVFATGERFAMLNRNKPIRDREGALIIPLISIRRTSVDQTDGDMTGRGMNQHTGDIVIKRRLSSKDRAYQKIVNKLGLTSQDGLANYSIEPAPVGNLSETGKSAELQDIQQGKLLAPVLNDNIYEFITLPQPQFYTATYEITFWTSYTQQMNSMMEILMSAQLPQGRCFRLDTPEGYWFVGYVDETKTSQDNFTDFAEQSRMIKYSFTMNVPAYLLAIRAQGLEEPVRRYYSAPRIRFDIEELIEGEESTDPSVGADDPTQNFTLDGPPAVSRKDYTERQLSAKRGVTKYVQDPFGDGNTRSFTRVLQENQKVGETVFSGKSITKLSNN